MPGAKGRDSHAVGFVFLQSWQGREPRSGVVRTKCPFPDSFDPRGAEAPWRRRMFAETAVRALAELKQCLAMVRNAMA
jgi:hypothetical protein